jgi:uncharacterized membrane protein YcaP (DUF421 family)
MSPQFMSMFLLSASPLEIMVRGSCMFILLFIIFRFILRRDVGSVGIGDFLFVVIVADASQNAMTGDAKTIADGVLLVATLVFWNFFLDWMSYKYYFVRRIIEPPSLLLVKAGRFQLKNMRREFITKEEVLAKLREQGLENLEQVKEVRLEGNGEISVVKKNGA